MFGLREAKEKEEEEEIGVRTCNKLPTDQMMNAACLTFYVKNKQTNKHKVHFVVEEIAKDERKYTHIQTE